uniref:F-box protein AT5G49610-like beta-propeller domain-containing protein n=1 Tax=Arundo donax TaxID=35708 RepID=A0A0A9HNT4_ARUDO
MSRRYRLLPPIPDSIVASVHVQERDLMSFQTFLLPSGSEEDEASFRVIGMAHCEKKTVVFVFSSVSGCWSVGASTKWDALSLTRCPLLPKPHYVYGCFYWRVLKRNKLIKLDMSRMEFSTVDLPPDHNKRGIVIVEAGEGRLGMFSLMAYDTSVYYAIRQREDVGANEWQMENVIPLPVNYNFYIDGAPGGYIFLLGIPKARDMVPAAWFSLEINTLKIQRVSGMRRHYCGVKPYFGFPPSMSPRRV